MSPRTPRFSLITAVLMGISAYLLVTGNGPFPLRSWLGPKPEDSVLAVQLPEVDLGYAIYRASHMNSIGQFYNFSNIRYATPPTEARRFSPPEEPLMDRNFIQDGIYGDRCVQAVPRWARELLGVEREYVGREDCLFLDVNVPIEVFQSREKKKVPVLVWIYGGGYVAGSKWQFGSGAAFLAAATEPIIYVALNYRVGLYGFMAGPRFRSEGGASNLGLLDQRFALEWVQQHIEAFGGDPRKVSVIGQSAGAGSIIHQVIAYGGQKETPFSQAIIQSPGFFPITDEAIMDEDYRIVLENAGCASAEHGLRCLRSVSEDKLQEANAEAIDSAPYARFRFGPTVNGEFVPDLPGSLLLNGAFDRTLKLMIGQNYNEAAVMNEDTEVDAAYFDRLLGHTTPNMTAEVKRYLTGSLYPPPAENMLGTNISSSLFPTYSIHPPYYSTWSSLINTFINDIIYVCLNNYLARAFSNQTYSYMISIPPGTHGVETPYQFYTEPDPRVQNVTLAHMFQKYITNFAIYGDPNGKGLPNMRQYGRENMITNIDLTSITPMKDPYAKEHCYWMQKGLYT